MLLLKGQRTQQLSASKLEVAALSLQLDDARFLSEGVHALAGWGCLLSLFQRCVPHAYELECEVFHMLGA